jgi:hypothetical protein
MAIDVSKRGARCRATGAFHASRLLRALVLLQLVAGLFLASTHQHHGASVGHSCAVCSAAQTAGTIPAASAQGAPPPRAEWVVAAVAEPHVPSAFRASFPSRAPPVA